MQEDKHSYNYITKYNNEMNLVPLRGFNALEIDLFFAICTKMKEQGSRQVFYDFSDLRALSEHKKHTTIQEFSDILENVFDKIQKLQYKEKKEGKKKSFSLFPYYEVDEYSQTVSVSLNLDLKHILNNLTGNFTRFELKELTAIRSSYSKNMFRILKQFRKSGYFIITIEDFRNRLDIPDSYRMSDINKRILNVIERDLSNNFRNLCIKKKNKGRKITHIEFIFDKEDDYVKPSSTIKNSTKSIEMTPEWLKEGYKSQSAVPPTEEEKREVQELLKKGFDD